MPNQGLELIPNEIIMWTYLSQIYMGGSSWNNFTIPFQFYQFYLDLLIIKWTIIKTIPVGVVNLLILTIQQIVAKKIPKKRRIINKNVLKTNLQIN